MAKTKAGPPRNGTQSLGRRLAAARRLSKRTQQAVADHIGVERPTVSMWENDHDKPGRDRITQLASLYGTSIDDLVRGEANILDDKTRPVAAPQINMGSRTEVKLARVAEPHFRQMPQNVPVLGTAAGGHEGEFLLNGEIAEYVRRPPGIANAPQVFALWITGDSMSPRYTEGDLIYVHPARRVRVGDDVLIEMRPTTDGERPAFVKRLVKMSDAEVTVEQFNPAQTMTFARDTVESVFKILTVSEMMGI